MPCFICKIWFYRLYDTFIASQFTCIAQRPKLWLRSALLSLISCLVFPQPYSQQANVYLPAFAARLQHIQVVVSTRFRPMELQQSAGELGKDRGLFHISQKSGHPVNAQVATIDEFPSVASY